MTPKQRMLAALEHRKPDRLPVTTHHLMQYYLDKYEGGISSQEFFDRYGLDPITWLVLHKPAPGSGDYFDPLQGEPGFLEARRIWSAQWRTEWEDIPDDTYKTRRYRFVTPKGTLTMVTQSNDQTTWVSEHPDQKQARHRFDRRIRHLALVRCGGDESGGRGIRRARPGAQPHSHASTFMGSRARGRTPAASIPPSNSSLQPTTIPPGCTSFCASCIGARRSTSNRWRERRSIWSNWAAAQPRQHGHLAQDF